MWYLRRFFFTSSFAIRLQLLRHFNPIRFWYKWPVLLETTGCLTQNDRLFYPKRRVVLLKTTGYFTQNDGLFYSKRRVVLLKTTGCFTQNDGLFYSKRRVVLFKTTGCFTQNDGLFYSKRRGVCCKVDEKHNPCNSRKRNCEKFYNAPSHAYACAHITGVLHFLLSQVSQASS